MCYCPMALRLDPPGHEPGPQAQFLAAIAYPLGDTGAAGDISGSGVSIGAARLKSYQLVKSRIGRLCAWEKVNVCIATAYGDRISYITMQ